MKKYFSGRYSFVSALLVSATVCLQLNAQNVQMGEAENVARALVVAQHLLRSQPGLSEQIEALLEQEKSDEVVQKVEQLAQTNAVSVPKSALSPREVEQGVRYETRTYLQKLLSDPASPLNSNRVSMRVRSKWRKKVHALLDA